MNRRFLSISITAAALCAMLAFAPMGAAFALPTEVWVCPSGDCGHPGFSFNTIQDGINGVEAGGIVNVAAGTYVEQLTINKALTLTGVNKTTTIVQSPNSLATCFTTKKPIICVNGANANISNLTVDGLGKGSGNSQFIGIGYYNAGGTVSNNIIVHLTGDSNGGVEMYAYNADASARTLTVSNNTMSEYEKNGMALAGSNLTVSVTGNEVTGAGATGAIAQNGIQVGYGAGGAVTGNTISGNAWTGTYGGSNNPFTDIHADGAAGILLYAPGAAVEVGGNTLTGNQFGVWSVASPSVNIHNNTITGMAHTGSAYPTGIAIFTADQWLAPDPEVGTTATVNNNTIETNDYGLIVLDYVAGTPSPSATAAGNSFEENRTQVASTAGTIDIAATLSGNTFDRAVTVDGSPLMPLIWGNIQDAVNAAVTGDTVHVAAGTYVENITIATPLTLAGADEATTIIKPAVSSPNCGSSDPGNAGGSLCGGGSNMILVQANDVTIHHFTLDGDNTGLTSPYNVGGANLDARNGIITNHNAGVYNNLEVHHVTVKNVFLRGMYASSGGTFNFHDNTVTNVRAVYESIAMFAYGGGPGVFQKNTVSYANDAISANHSSGIQFLDNTVTNSGSGVHTDNSNDGGGVADLIQGNTISDCDTAAGGYGIFVFVPYRAPTVNNNTITNCQYGLSAWGQGPGKVITTRFTNNTVTGPSAAADSVGAYITTDQISWGYEDVSVLFTGNVITGFEKGVFLTADQQSWNPYPWVSKTITAAFHCNEIEGNTTGADMGTTGTILNDMTYNWWGDATGPGGVGPGSGDPVVAGINYSPWTTAPGCSSVPPYITSTMFTGDSPDPSGVGEDVTINFNVLNILTDGPVPHGTDGMVDVLDGATVICDNVVLDDSGNGSCSHAFSATGVHTLTAKFTPTSAASFTASQGMATHIVANIVTYLSGARPDGWILESSETSGKGGTKNASSGTLRVGDDADNKQYRSILHFGTGGLPDNAIVTGATLEFKKSGQVGTNPFKSLGNLLADVRKGTFSKFRLLQLSDFGAMASANQVLSYGNSPVSGWYSLPLSASDLKYINTMGATQFRLRFTKDDNNNLVADYLKLFSGNAAAADRPRLIIQYYVP